MQAAHGFGLPTDPATPIVMVGPGTGVAPFRSFLWHRRAMKAPGKARPFGHQRQACDFFYREELEAFVARGTLTRLSTAWSRDGDKKIYAQHRMREAGAELWSWLQAGAHVVRARRCQAHGQGRGQTAVVDIAAEHGGLGATQARAFVEAMKAAGRYQADVY